MRAIKILVEEPVGKLKYVASVLSNGRTAIRYADEAKTLWLKKGHCSLCSEHIFRPFSDDLTGLASFERGLMFGKVPNHLCNSCSNKLIRSSQMHNRYFNHLYNFTAENIDEIKRNI